ncbi:hypothetical protein BTHA_2719 [Burkholderia thailandensis MSMB59]|uniref:DUF1566 domain-containing protein n=1 Tax=Burkholderia thailandensis TaxID=57975 RepID=UPI0005154493|nr:DUF1566 domain-containing protein [Burkholderia thailandensis]AIS96241.1 hypothetical protein BTHA_2719 [Burkholderia thailandensis MSMB59]AOJ44848.1 hypothetical protein WJ27_06830 [Burkholderia thailandensis]KVG16638.1 hypothetical protein WJ28_12545 [Burkholderia thailandensis]
MSTISATAVTLPELAEGELYAGILIGKDGAASQHIILLPGAADEVNWDDAKAWAASIGGELPTRREQALLYANLPEQFERDWYWSGEAHRESGWAWSQTFDNGHQSSSHQSYELRARAVRRLSI